MTLSGYYTRGVIYPSLIVFVAMVVYSIIDNYWYKSEWLTADAAIMLSILAGCIYCLIIMVLSLTLFLNRFVSVRENALFNFLSWFLLPIGFLSFITISRISHMLRYRESVGSDIWYFVILDIPFIVGLGWTYVRQRQNAH